jgi:two-component sensor histidine kinase
MLACILISCSSGKEEAPLQVHNYQSYTKDTTTVASLLKRSNDFVRTNFDSVHYYANQALELSMAANYPLGVARAKADLAQYQRRIGNYAEAIATGLESIRIYDSLHVWSELVMTKNLLADFYKEMGGEKHTTAFQQKALEISMEAQHIAEREKYMPGVVNSLNERGIILRDMSKTTGRKDLMDSAFQLYKKGISIIETTGEGEDDLFKFYNNISQVYNEHYQDYTRALAYQMKAVDYNTKRNNRHRLTYNYNTIAEVYMNMGNMTLANEYGHRMLALGDELKSPFRLVNAYSLLTRINRKMQRFDSALYFQDLWINLSDSINNLTRSNQIADMQVKYETDKKEERISYLNGLDKVKSQRMLMLVGAMLVLLLLLTVVWFQKRRSQQQQQKIREQSEKLQWMMKELHHRVKNNLQIVSSLLNLQSYRIKDEESQTAMRESQLRVQAMSLMHQRLYQVDDVSLVNFKLYLTDLAEILMKAYGYVPDDFDLTIDVEKEMLDVDTVMPMGLLVNEIITNAFKYAYKNVVRPALHISLTENSNQLKLDISDNGPGMEASGVNKDGFGKKLIAALSKQLKATCQVKNELGTSYSFIIPVNSGKAA